MRIDRVRRAWRGAGLFLLLGATLLAGSSAGAGETTRVSLDAIAEQPERPCQVGSERISGGSVPGSVSPGRGAPPTKMTSGLSYTDGVRKAQIAQPHTSRPQRTYDSS